MARKKLQKLFALLLTFSMTMSLLGVGAFAAEETGGASGGTSVIQLDSLTLPDDFPASLEVEYGTSLEDVLAQLNLPGTLTGSYTVEEAPVEVNLLSNELEEEQVIEKSEEEPNPGEGENVQNPGEGESVQNPGEGENVQNPGEGESVQNPGEGENVQDPGEGENVQNPGEGENVQDPGEDGDLTVLTAESLQYDEPSAAPAPAVTSTTVEVPDIPVTWTCKDYDPFMSGLYSIVPVLGEGYEYVGTDPLPSVPVTVGSKPEYVAQIGATKYGTLDEAVAGAVDGDTIELLANCTTEGLNLSKDLTIQSAEGQRYTVNFTEYGIALWGKALTFRDCDVVMNGIGSTPYTAEWNWMTICANKDASLSLDNVRMTMDGTNAGNAHAIYFCSNNQLNLDHGSVLTIQNYQEDALEWDGGDGGYNVNITDSTYISDHNRSGFTGTFYATIDHSTVKVINSSGNGSNGTYYTIKNQSDVLFDKNGSWGISAYRIDMSNDSTLTATNNEYSGVWTRILNVDGTCTLDVENNGYGGACDLAGTSTGSVSNAGILFWGNGSTPSVIEEGAQVTIRNNAGSGINTRQGDCNLTIYSATITNNGTNPSGVGAVCGGGVYNIGTMILGEDVVIYNNHADTAGDDIYSAPTSDTKTITFGKVGSGWKLDGDPDCTDAIDGWYDDSADARWEAHDLPYHAVEFTGFEILNGMATVEGVLALKAAHGLIPLQPGDPELPEWETSKSKTATALDANYESQVTLSLPAKEEELVSDVVFVLDSSSCRESVAQDALDMLDRLEKQVSATEAQVNIGVVVYRGNATERQFPLQKLTESSLEALRNFMQQGEPEERGSNMHAGLLGAQTMLQASSTDNARKYMVLISDGITYSWDQNGVQYAAAYEADAAQCASNTAWEVWYGSLDWVPKEGWDAYLDGRVEMITRTLQDHATPYDRTNVQNPIPRNERDIYANCVDVALYKCREVYRELQSAYHCYAMLSGNLGQYGASFMEYLANGEEVSFDEIQKDIYYLLDEGSKVVDVIGYGKDSQGKDYNFDFVDSLDKLTLTVGGVAQNKTELVDPQYNDPYATSAYGFGDNGNGYDYVVTYYKNGQDGKSDECFVWEINVPVSNFAPVQLTYSVKLTNPQTAAGTYEDLNTNTEAILHPVDSKGDSGTPEAFEKPTVDYTVPGGGTGTEDPEDPRPPHDDDDDDDEPTNIPDENTPTTDLPDPETPTTELPEEETPTTDIPEEETPTTELPDENTPTTDIPEEDTPLAEVPETGDLSALWLALTALSGTGLAGVTFLGRKKRDEE